MVAHAGVEIKIAYFTHVGALHVAKNESRFMFGDEAKEIIALWITSQVNDFGPGLKASARNFQIVGFNGDDDLSLAERANDGQQFLQGRFGIDARRVGEGGFDSDVDYC